MSTNLRKSQDEFLSNSQRNIIPAEIAGFGEISKKFPRGISVVIPVEISEGILVGIKTS